MDRYQRNSIIENFPFICHNVPTENLREEFNDIFSQEQKHYFTLLQNDYLRNEMMISIILQTEQSNLFQRFSDFLCQFQANERNLGALVADSYKTESTRAVHSDRDAPDNRFHVAPVYRSVTDMYNIISTIKRKGNLTNYNLVCIIENCR